MFLYNFVAVFFDIVYFLLIIRILLSFFPFSPFSGPFLTNLVRRLYQLTEPILAPFRKIIPPLGIGGGYIDFSPILVLFLLRLLRTLLLRMILGY